MNQEDGTEKDDNDKLKAALRDTTSCKTEHSMERQYHRCINFCRGR